jgi:UDP-N-acetylmuramoylalanine--D-glutamate ligase
VNWDDLRGRRVGVYGLGREGLANVRACLARDVRPILVDDAATGTAEGLPVLGTADGGLDALLSCDVVVKTPGISPLAPSVAALRASGVEVVGGLGLWLAGAELSKVVCLTGTKGKSTTTALLAHLANGLGVRTLAAGNIGVPPHDPASDAQSYDLVAVEVSSYQAADIRVAPPAVGVTSLHPDHLPWHGDLEAYYRDKLSLCTRPGADLTVANGDSDLLRERRDQLGPRVEWVGEDDDPGSTWMQPLRLLGGHNRRNALIARRLLVALGVPGADDEARLERASHGYAGLESRLRLIGTRGGVDFVDDGLSTNVLSTLAAVDAFPERRVALLVGGQSRGIDYAPLASGLRSRVAPLLVVTMPDNGPDIRAAIESVGAGPMVRAVQANSLEDAVGQGFRWAGSGGVVLLSPAAPSFGRFADYRARGEAFAEASEAV